MNRPHEFFVIVERDEDGMYVGAVPNLPACYRQGPTIDELMANMRGVIELCLEEPLNIESMSDFVGVRKVAG